MYLWHYAVPSPMVNISRTNDGILYAGSVLILTCSIELSSLTNIDIAVSGTWRRSSEQLSNDDRISISSPTQVGASSYETVLQFNPLSQIQDSGVYTCVVVVAPDPPSEFIEDVTISASESITVQSRPSTLANINNSS